MRLSKVIANAQRILREEHPRAGYASDVLCNVQNWSGSDLKGKARKYSTGYYHQRGHAYDALYRAGGQVIPVRHGRLVSAVCVGVDDYGNKVFETRGGYVVPTTRLGHCHPI
jgi:hypothetical protein